MLAKRLTIPLIVRPINIRKTPNVANKNPRIPSFSRINSKAKRPIPNTVIKIRKMTHFIMHLPLHKVKFHSVGYYSFPTDNKGTKDKNVTSCDNSFFRSQVHKNIPYPSTSP